MMPDLGNADASGIQCFKLKCNGPSFGHVMSYMS